MRVAAIDIGTNTVLLLILEVEKDGRLVPVVDRAEITRLGEGVDRSRTLLPEAVERTLVCLGRYAEEIAKHDVARVDVVGTSAMRDAAVKGGGENTFVARARAILGVAPRVVSGNEEAALAFSGGVVGLGLAGEVVAFDVGGGSTELIRGNVSGAGAEVHERKSLDVGSVRLFERHVRSDPPTAMEMSLVRTFVLDQLLGVPKPPPGRPLVGMAGTVTTLAAIARGIEPYDSSRVHGLRLGAGEIGETARRLVSMPLSERVGTRGLEPKRADVIPVGAAIVEAVVAWSGASEVIVSDRGVRWGAAIELAAHGS